MGLETSWSHTQFEKFTACPRRYYHYYVLDKKEQDKAGISAQFSRMLVHPLLGAIYEGRKWNDEEMGGYHAHFISQVGEIARLQGQYGIGVLEQLRALYIKIVEADMEAYSTRIVEPRLMVNVKGCIVVVKPDIVLQNRKNGFQDVPLDFKVSAYEQPKNSLPYNDQFVGQCIATGSDFYLCDNIKVTKAGKVSRIREQVFVSLELKEEWFDEQAVMIATRNAALGSNVWPKHSQNCYQFNQPCPFIVNCSTGRTYGGTT